MNQDGPLAHIDAEGSSLLGPGRWLVRWTVSNQGDADLDILEAWLPHGEFRAPRQQLMPPLKVPPGGQAQIETPVDVAARPSGVVENGFVILRAAWRGAQWRILARVRVAVAEDGRPVPTTELITVQRVGFAP